MQDNLSNIPSESTRKPLTFAENALLTGKILLITAVIMGALWAIVLMIE